LGRRFIAALMLLLLIVSTIASAFMIQPVGAAGAIYIRADGSIEPSGAPIASSDNVTYILTNSTSDSIYIERSNIIFHGNSYSMLGSGSGVGIDLNDVGNVTVENMHIVGYQWGIYVRNSNLRNSIVQNYLAANQYGIFVSLAHNNIVSDNDVVNCTYTGIYLSYSTNNTIFRNDIETNYVGIDIQSASNNKFYHNNLIRNSLLQAYIVTNASQSPNVWDYGYPTCGNYWSDYNGTDSKSGPFQNEIGADAVGDTPYYIDSNNTDGYPLVNPWSTNFTVSNHMVVGYGSKPMTLDPARAMMVADEELLMNVYEPLIFYDEEKTDQFVPRLATSWMISPDGLTYTFNIRQGVKFHNNEILKPEDVEYSLERIFVIESGLAGWMFYEAFFNISGSRDEQGHFRVTGQQLDDAVTSTDTAVSLHLTTPYPPLLQILAQPYLSILCKKWCIQIGDWSGTFSNWTLYNLPATTAIETQSALPPGPHTNAMCGTGPFMLDYYDNETSLQWQLVKFDGYWGGWPANGAGGFLKRITGKIIYDWETRKNSFLDGQLDSLQVPRAGVDEVLGQPGVSSIYPLEQLVCDTLLFTFNISTSSPFMGVPGGLPKGTLSESGIPPDFFTDINVRKGFAYAFNYSKLITEAIRGEASQPATPILPGLPYYNPAQEKYSTDLTKAALCFNASWSGELWTSGFNFTITYSPQNTIRQKACEIIKANVESLNSKFHIQIQSVSYNNYCDFVQNHSFPMFSFGWLADYADPQDFAYGFMYSKGAFAQWQLYSNSTIDALVQQGITTMNDTARRQAYYDLQTAYHQDCPSVPLYQPVGRRFQRDWVQGWYYNPLLSDNYFYSEWKGDMSKSTRYSWDMFHHDPTHIGYSDSAAPGTNQKLWSYATSGEVHSSPAVADGKVYVGSLDNSVYCLDALTGAKIWNYTTGNSVWSSPAVANAKVYVGSNDNRLYCLDALTGAQIWNYTTGYYVTSSPAVADGKVYVGSWDDKVYCLDASTGAQVWNYATGNYVRSSPAVVGGKVYAGSADHRVYCLDALTGVQIWNYTTGTSVFSSPAVVDDRVYVGSDDDRLYCLDAFTGTQIWSYTAGNHVDSSPAVADGKVYVGSWDNNVYCLDALTGAKIWNYTTSGWTFSSPAVADGKVYVGSLDNSVYCLDALTGTQIWNYTTSGPVYSSPAISDGVVFIGSFDSGVYAFGNTIRVPQDYATIQAAINAAAPGATIWIAPGVYNESVVVNKPITLIGKIGSEPTFNGGGSGIAITIVSGGSGSTIAGITITSWDQGIVINGASGCKVYDNILSLINQNGIALEGSTASNNQIYSNIFQQDTVAITLTASSTNNIVFNNIITSNSIGLDVESSGNVVCANMMTENQVAISIKNSNNNKFFHNDFVSNDVQLVIAASTGNVWDDGYPSGGNYWSDHTGPDMFSGPNQDQAGSDGIVDTSYTIATGSVDRYPLAHGAHDVGITSVTMSKTVVGKGCTLHVELKILNYGMYDENFPVAAYANTSTAVTQSIALTKGSYIIVTLTWNTSSLAYGNYTISAYAWPVPDEANTADNTFTYGLVSVTIIGDVDGNGNVNVLDAIDVSNSFGKGIGQAGFNANADFDDNGVINILDAITLANNFGQHYP